MLKYFLFVLIPTISLGLSVDKLDKLIEDRVQNTELDGDNVDFPPSLVDDLEETKEANTEEDNKEGIKETDLVLEVGHLKNPVKFRRSTKIHTKT